MTITIINISIIITIMSSIIINTIMTIIIIVHRVALRAPPSRCSAPPQ